MLGLMLIQKEKYLTIDFIMTSTTI